MSGSRRQEEPENALSVLLAALPVDVASSIEAGFSVVTHDLFATSNAETTRPTSLPSPSNSIDQITTSTSRPGRRPTTLKESERPTSGYTARPTSDISSSRSTRRPEKSLASSSNTSRPTTLITRSSTTITPTPRPKPASSTTSTSTSTPPPTQPPPTAQDSSKTTPTPEITPEKQNSNGTIAGIATGSAAALVLLTLAIFFLLRRRRRQKALKAIAGKADQPYPEVAFLYDPVQSPPRSRSPAPLLGGADAGADGVVGSRRESAMTQAQRSSLLAPEVVVVPEGEHLLAPGRAVSREGSPSGMGQAR